MNIRPIEGEPKRFFVQSDSNPADEYLVDVEELDGNGQCGCVSFEKRLGPKVGKEPGPHRCKHLLAVFAKLDRIETMEKDAP